MNTTKVAAFFDFDQTLVEVETGRMAMQWMRDNRMILPGFMLKVLIANVLYKLGILSEERMLRVMLTFYKGRKLDDFRKGSENFYREYLQPHLAPAILSRVAFHKERGHLLVLISASLRYLLEPVMEDLGFDVLLCTDLEEGKDGLLTGRPTWPVCIREHKKEFTLKIAREYGLNLEESYAYGDSHSDLPLLELVGHPHAVEPSPLLETIARQRGWPILSYR
ncbi:MAG TPA: HAD family hydrolase [Syntrophales bacterium]|nr:HAD family hydrolase [Syntrophales bacterium]HPQ43534.1 HAD family hydrolase [Syntrophales bacterium]